MANGWKITAIIFMTLFIMETAFVGWGMYLVSHEEDVRNECYYEYCADSYDAMWNVNVLNNICYCYNEDYEVIRQTPMK